MRPPEGKPPDPAETFPRWLLARYRRAARSQRGDARAAAQRRSSKPGSGTSRLRPRDPQPVGGVLESLALDQGWATDIAVWSLTQDWAGIVGDHVAQHVRVLEFRPDDNAPQTPAPEARRGRQASLLGDDDPAEAPGRGGRLVLQADSDAWVAHVKFLRRTLQATLDRELGVGVVGRIEVLGPVARKSHGPLRVKYRK